MQFVAVTTSTFNLVLSVWVSLELVITFDPNQLCVRYSSKDTLINLHTYRFYAVISMMLEWPALRKMTNLCLSRTPRQTSRHCAHERMTFGYDGSMTYDIKYSIHSTYFVTGMLQYQYYSTHPTMTRSHDCIVCCADDEQQQKIIQPLTDSR